jgi:hypothetical protein
MRNCCLLLSSLQNLTCHPVYLGQILHVPVSIGLASKEYGDPTIFLTQKQHLDLRVTTRTLRATHKLHDVPKRGLRVINTNTMKRNQSGLYLRLRDLENLLARHLEVVKMTVPNEAENLVQIFSEEPKVPDDEDVEEGHVYFTNPDPAEDKKTEGSVEKGECVPLHVECRLLESGNPNTSPGLWLLEKFDVVKCKGVRIDAQLDLHASVVLSLIEATHNAQDSDLKTAKERLAQHGMLFSIAKMVGRLKRGWLRHDSNLFRYLTRVPDISDVSDEDILKSDDEEGRSVREDIIPEAFVKLVMDNLALWNALPEELESSAFKSRTLQHRD